MAVYGELLLGSDWCDEPADSPSGGGEGGVDPDRDIVVECVTGCLEWQGCTFGYLKQPAYRNNVWTNDDEYGLKTRIRNTSIWSSGGSRERAAGEGWRKTLETGTT